MIQIHDYMSKQIALHESLLGEALGAVGLYVCVASRHCTYIDRLANPLSIDLPFLALQFLPNKRSNDPSASTNQVSR